MVSLSVFLRHASYTHNRIQNPLEANETILVRPDNSIFCLHLPEVTDSGCMLIVKIVGT